MLSALGLATALAYTPGFFQAATVGRWALVSLGLAWLWRQPKLTLGHLAIAAWLAYASLSLAWTPDLLNGLQHLWWIALIGLGFCVGAEQESLRKFVLWTGVGLGVNLAIVLGQTWGWSPVWQGPSPSGLFYNKNYLAEASALIIVLALQYRLWALALALAPMIVLTHCREAELGLVLAGLVWLWPRAPKITIELGVAIGCVAVLYGDPQTLGYRVIMWQDSLAHLAPFGHGLGSFFTLYPAFGHAFGTTWGRPEYPHNEFIYGLFELGPGIIAPLGLGIWCFGQAAFRPVLVTIATLAMFGFPLQLPLTLLIISLTLGQCARGREFACSSKSLRRAGAHAIA